MVKVLGLVRVLGRWVVCWVVCWVAYWHKERLMWSGSLYLLSENSNILLRLCPNVDQSWIGDVSVDWYLSVMIGVVGDDQ